MSEIVVWEDEKFFILIELETVPFHNHFMAYEVERTEPEQLICVMIYWVILFRKMARNSLCRKTLPVSKTHFKEREFFYFTFCHCLHIPLKTMLNTKAQNPHVI